MKVVIRIALAGLVVAVAVVALQQLQVQRRAEQLTSCRTNLKNLGMALETYSTDASGRYPPSDRSMRSGLACLVPSYLETIPTCPAAGRDTYSESYQNAA